MPDTNKTSIEHRSVLENKKIMEERKEKSRFSLNKDANPRIPAVERNITGNKIEWKN